CTDEGDRRSGNSDHAHRGQVEDESEPRNGGSGRRPGWISREGADVGGDRGAGRNVRRNHITRMTESQMAQSDGAYADVNGLRMYYEIHGSGFPLVLIHGGGSTIGTTFGRI